METSEQKELKLVSDRLSKAHGVERDGPKDGRRKSVRLSIQEQERRKGKPVLTSGVRKITSLEEAKKFISTLNTGDIFLHKSTGEWPLAEVMSNMFIKKANERRFLCAERFFVCAFRS